MAEQNRITVDRPCPDRHREVMVAWERFLSQDRIPPNAIRRLVEDSWSRCASEGVDPTRHFAPIGRDESELDGLRQRNQELLEAARPVAAQARPFLAQSGTVLVIADPNGVVLHTVGDPGTIDAADAIHLSPGGAWSEAQVGTNAIGTALAARGPVQIHAAEHFCEGIKEWTCSATLIDDPFDHRVMGVIDVSGLRGTFDPHCLALAVTVAGRITERVMQRALKRRSRLLDATLAQFYGGGSDGLMVFDERGRIVRANDQAAMALRARGARMPSETGLAVALLRENRLLDANGHVIDTFETKWTVPVTIGSDRLGTLVIVPVVRQAARPVPTPEPAAQPSGPFQRILKAAPSLVTEVRTAERLAKLPVPVLLHGETGVGKELFARAIHDSSSRTSGPFVAINCGSLSRDLLASELFGYAEGAFTGARRGGMKGKIEAADGGTLFLDEVGELPLDMQPYLLRVLQENEIYRLGENIPRQVNFRLLAATNRDLRDEAAQGIFRMDLFYRLSVMSISLPALRERPQDIAPLAQALMRNAARAYELPEKPLSAGFIAALCDYSWPGNIRELRNAVEAALLMSGGNTIVVDDLPQEYRPDAGMAARQPDGQDTAGDSGLLESAEKKAIIAAIAAEDGNLTRTARALGIAKSTLYLKMKKFGIKRHNAPH